MGQREVMSSLVRERSFAVDPQELLPALTPDNEPYWSALAQGRLQVQSCSDCKTHRFPIAPVCPACGSTQTQWTTLDGTGVIHSCVRMHKGYLAAFADLLPYVVATVQLKEGVRMYARLVDDGPDVHIGQAVRMQIERWPDGRCVPVFQPLEKTK